MTGLELSIEVERLRKALEHIVSPIEDECCNRAWEEDSLHSHYEEVARKALGFHAPELAAAYEKLAAAARREVYRTGGMGGYAPEMGEALDEISHLENGLSS